MSESSSVLNFISLGTRVRVFKVTKIMFSHHTKTHFPRKNIPACSFFAFFDKNKLENLFIFGRFHVICYFCSKISKNSSSYPL